MKKVKSDVPTIEEIQSLYKKGDIEQLRALNERLAKRSNQRMTSLKKAGLDTTAAMTRAQRDIENIGISSGRFSRSKKMSAEDLYQQVKSEANFLRWQTSTVSGEIKRREKIWESLTSQRIDEETGDIKNPAIDLSGVEDIDAFKKNFLKFLDDGAWEELKKHIYTKNILNEAGEAIAAGASVEELSKAMENYINGNTEDDLLTIWDNWTSVK
ncbi:MAG: hypothetical protein J6S67_16555 [Methanobrevibacter sp.]|nr:hypothetical protein [Methanobrevibacter sp.]